MTTRLGHAVVLLVAFVVAVVIFCGGLALGQDTPSWTASQAAWFGAVSSVVLVVLGLWGHYKTCTCAHSQRGRAARPVQPPSY